MKCSTTWNKLQISLGLNIFGNFLNYVTAQLNKTYIKCPVVFRYFNADMLHIMSLIF